jgi:hypothetical protein
MALLASDMRAHSGYREFRVTAIDRRLSRAAPASSGTKIAAKQIDAQKRWLVADSSISGGKLEPPRAIANDLQRRIV